MEINVKKVQKLWKLYLVYHGEVCCMLSVRQKEKREMNLELVYDNERECNNKCKGYMLKI